MLVVQLRDGLGNQMFIYSFAMSLKQLGYEVIIDASWYNNSNNINPKFNAKDCTVRDLEIQNFNISMPIVRDFNPKKFFLKHDLQFPFYKILKNLIPRRFRRHNYRFCIPESLFLKKYQVQGANLKIRPNSYFTGSYQNLIYFKEIRPILLKEFSPKTVLSKTNEDLKTRILNTKNSVFLHIRRGDFLVNKYWYLVQLGSTYYNAALHGILQKVQNPHVFVFSNDILWCKNNLIQKLDSKIIKNMNIEFIENNDESQAFEEFELMRSCKHAIIANSTFSWWAAYLMENEDKMVIMPSKMVNNLDALHEISNISFPNCYMIDSIWGDFV